MFLIIFSSLLSLWSLTGTSSEVDDFSTRTQLKTKQDARPLFNQIIEQQLEGAANEFNRGVECDESEKTELTLLQILKLRLITVAPGESRITQPQPNIESWLGATREESNSLFVRTFKGLWTLHPFRRDLVGEAIQPDFGAYGLRLPFEQTIYGTLTNLWDDPEGGAMSKVTLFFYPNFVLGSMKLSGKHGDATVGIDKIGHFFWEGLDYFRMWAYEKKSLAEIFAWGTETERTIWGLGEGFHLGFSLPEHTPGVFSYGDLAANAFGMRFWHRLLRGEKPYYVCENQKLVRTKNNPFDFADYHPEAWDQGNNCSIYRKNVGTKVEQRVAALGLSCPVDQSVCESLKKLPYARAYVNWDCTGSSQLRNEKAFGTLTEEDLQKSFF